MTTAITIGQHHSLGDGRNIIAKACSPRRYYVPGRSQGQVEGGRLKTQESTRSVHSTLPTQAKERMAQRPPEGLTPRHALSQTVSVTSATGGIGTSTLAALLAMTLCQQHEGAVLIDADIRMNGAGLDVLLGMEHDQGRRWQDIHAPLAQLDGVALLQELPLWQDTAVLTFDPWMAQQPPQWFEVQAAVSALAAQGKPVVVDAGLGTAFTHVADLMASAMVIAVELSVLGLARTKAYLAWLDQLWQEHASSASPNSQALAAHAAPQPLLVGITPRGAQHARGVVPQPDAEDYLDMALLGTVRADARLCSDVLDGMGLDRISKPMARVIGDVANAVQRLWHGEGAAEQGSRAASAAHGNHTSGASR
ncbi:P-loop NTPase [Bifidobacterium gallicum]|uniref:Septum site determining protein n=1 Tax=Bifidobacterium gallicum DSM 20093 = LMG 11596 TaxID=561180 RepID=D1NVY1_9BIFI|nr:P-loop NTPase [Bifidobacterium gallicum]EFA22267.1 hypothetical protein BIFGAL_04025 [Bifidobacterium gallicum DSM 20093 = LMG 11596]KFI60000.1 septum site determining protein [Bifidobacterium gallicum DSM 20093 = LMG 11596]